MGKKGPLWWRESDWLLRGSSAANQILLRHSGPILSIAIHNALPSGRGFPLSIFIFILLRLWRVGVRHTKEYVVIMYAQ